jgi:hypothetical protein
MKEIISINGNKLLKLFKNIEYNDVTKTLKIKNFGKYLETPLQPMAYGTT